MKKALKFELKRKFIHLFSLLYILIYYFIGREYGHVKGLLVLAGVLIFFLILEFYRIKLGKKIPVFYIFWRGRERGKLGGHVFFVLGALIAFSVFDFRIAIAALLMTTFGDMAAALFGIQFGKHWIRRLKDRAWEGVVAEFIVNLVIGFILIESWIVVLGMALAATYVESVFDFIDDNLSIPLFAGFVGQVLSMVV